MPKVTAAIAALVLAIGLAGCAADTTAGAGQPDASEPRPEASQQMESPEPLSVEPEVAEEADTEREYLAVIRERLAIAGDQLNDATDAQLLAAAEDACQQLAAGTPYKDISVVQGDIQSDGWYRYSAPIVVFAGMILCPDVYPDDALHVAY